MLSQTAEANAMRKLRERRKTQGICQRCGKVPAREGKILCQGCADTVSKYKAPYNPRKERIRRIKLNISGTLWKMWETLRTRKRLLL